MAKKDQPVQANWRGQISLSGYGVRRNGWYVVDALDDGCFILTPTGPKADTPISEDELDQILSGEY